MHECAVSRSSAVAQGRSSAHTAKQRQNLHTNSTAPAASVDLRRGGRVLLTEILLPRIVRQGAVCLSSIRGQTRKARIEKFELDECFPTASSPLPSSPPRGSGGAVAWRTRAAPRPEKYVHIHVCVYIYIYIYIYGHICTMRVSCLFVVLVMLCCSYVICVCFLYLFEFPSALVWGSRRPLARSPSAPIYIYIYIYVHMYVHLLIMYMCIYIYIHNHMYVYIYIYIYVYMYVYIYIYMYTHNTYIYIYI